jgi:hypothetical protein
VSSREAGGLVVIITAAHRELVRWEISEFSEEWYLKPPPRAYPEIASALANGDELVLVLRRSRAREGRPTREPSPPGERVP